MSNEIVQTSEQNNVTQELLLDYLKTMNKNLNEQQTKQFLAVAGTFGLNPWKREVYAVTYKNKDGGYDMSIVTGYETYIKRAEMNPNYDGYDIEFRGEFVRGKATKHGKNGDWQVDAIIPKGTCSCVCTVYRKDRNHPVVEEVFFDEYDQGNSMWQTKPRTMLKKCAIVAAFRKAFPFDFGGMPYTADELPDHSAADNLRAQGNTVIDTTTAEPQPEKPQLTEAQKAFTEEMKSWKASCPEVYKTIIDEVKSRFGKLTAIPESDYEQIRERWNNLMTAYAQANAGLQEEPVEF